MSDIEERRLNRLHQDGEKRIDSFELEKLSYLDFILLLKNDENVHELIRSILIDEDDAGDHGDLECQADHIAESAPAAISAAMPEVCQEHADLRTELLNEFTLLQHVRADQELAGAWLGDTDEAEARQLVRLIAVVAQWDQVLQLWDRLVARCKANRRHANDTEMCILLSSLAVHNLIWHGQQAQLCSVDIGDDFDFTQHGRGTPRGDKVKAVWLPGIVNAAGMVCRKPLIMT